jgi:hypothetical protein
MSTPDAVFADQAAALLGTRAWRNTRSRSTPTSSPRPTGSSRSSHAPSSWGVLQLHYRGADGAAGPEIRHRMLAPAVGAAGFKGSRPSRCSTRRSRLSSPRSSPSNPSPRARADRRIRRSREGRRCEEERR